MAEEPQPSTVTEGATEGTSPLPASNAEDRKAAAAMSSLDTKTDDAAPKKEVDIKALNEAMSKLGGMPGAGGEGKVAKEKEKKEEPKKLIKVDQADVTVLAEQLDMPKTKATELLRAHDANAVAAMRAWVTAAV